MAQNTGSAALPSSVGEGCAGLPAGERILEVPHLALHLEREVLEAAQRLLARGGAVEIVPIGRATWRGESENTFLFAAHQVRRGMRAARPLGVMENPGATASTSGRAADHFEPTEVGDGCGDPDALRAATAATWTA